MCGCAANIVVHVVPYNENYKRKNVSAQVASLAYFRAMRRKILLRKLKHIAQIRHNEKQIGYRLQDFVDWIFDVCVFSSTFLPSVPLISGTIFYFNNMSLEAKRVTTAIMGWNPE